MRDVVVSQQTSAENTITDAIVMERGGVNADKGGEPAEPGFLQFGQATLYFAAPVRKNPIRVSESTPLWR